MTEAVQEAVAAAFEENVRFDVRANIYTLIAITGVILYWRGVWNSWCALANEHTVWHSAHQNSYQSRHHDPLQQFEPLLYEEHLNSDLQSYLHLLSSSYRCSITWSTCNSCLDTGYGVIVSPGRHVQSAARCKSRLASESAVLSHGQSARFHASGQDVAQYLCCACLHRPTVLDVACLFDSSSVCKALASTLLQGLFFAVQGLFFWLVYPERNRLCSHRLGSHDHYALPASSLGRKLAWRLRLFRTASMCCCQLSAVSESSYSRRNQLQTICMQ